MKASDSSVGVYPQYPYGNSAVFECVLARDATHFWKPILFSTHVSHMLRFMSYKTVYVCNVSVYFAKVLSVNTQLKRWLAT